MDDEKPKAPDSKPPGPKKGPDPGAADGGEKPAPGKPKPAAADSPDDDAPAKSSGDDKKPAPAAKPPSKDAAAAKPKPKPPPRRPPQRGPAYEDLEEDALLDGLRAEFGDEAVSGQSFLGQTIYTIASDVLYDAMLFLRDRPEWGFDYLVDLTALDHLPEEPRFCLVYHLYAYPEGPLIRVKSRIAEGEYAPSVTTIWATADWMEREVFDMFGIEFSGHPDLRRILLPDDWHGFPLRKDYDIKLQDQAWIRKHLRIRKVPD